MSSTTAQVSAPVAQADSVTESPAMPTMATVVASIVGSEAAALARVAAAEHDEAAFGAMCVEIFRAIELKVTNAKTIAAEAVKAGAATITSGSQVGYVRMAGRILNLPGDLPKGITQRDVWRLFQQKKTIAGKPLEIGCSAIQFNAIPADKFSDVASAYAAVRKIVIANETAKREAAADAAAKVAPTTPDAGEGEGEGEAPTATTPDAPTTAAELLTEALALVRAAQAKSDEDGHDDAAHGVALQLLSALVAMTGAAA